MATVSEDGWTSVECESAACLEVKRFSNDAIYLRVSRKAWRSGNPMLGLTDEEWAAFLAEAKAGSFDSI